MNRERVLTFTALLLLLLVHVATAAKDVKVLDLPQLVDSSSCKVVDPDNLLDPSIRKDAEVLLGNIYSAYHVLSTIVVVNRQRYNDPNLANTIINHYDIKSGVNKMVAVITVHPMRFKMVSGDKNFKDYWYESAVKDALKKNDPNGAVTSLTYAFVKDFPKAFTDEQMELVLNGYKEPLSSFDGRNVQQATKGTKEWNAQNITLPHTKDAKRYVSNPENILSAAAEDIVNKIMRKMDTELGIESAVVVVNHVEGRDVFRMAQGLFDKYGIGRNNRGLVIILAYKDRLIRTHTGSSLESDLPNSVCSRLHREYAIPAMRANNPDAGMIDLTRAIYYTLKREKVPNADDDPLIPKGFEAETLTDTHSTFSFLSEDVMKYIIVGLFLLPLFIGTRLGKYLVKIKDDDTNDIDRRNKLYIAAILIAGLFIYIGVTVATHSFSVLEFFLSLFGGGIICGYTGLSKFLPLGGGGNSGGYGGGGSDGGGDSSGW